MQQIADWLEKLGMSEYAERFAENRIDLSVLPDLTDQHLKDLGIALGDRLKMLRAIRQLADAIPASPRPPLTEPTSQDNVERRQQAPVPAAATPPSISVAVEPTGERRHVTVMFCDLVDSTGIASRLDAEEWRDLVGAYLDAASSAVTEMGGKVAKKLGDGLMALFGYPVAHENDAERAARAALAIQRSLAELNRKNVASGKPALAARIAIDTGPVVVDATGEIFGDVPNIAARAQALAEPGSVVVTARVQRQVSGLFVAEERGSHELKGVPEPVALFRIVRASGGGRRAGQRHLTPLVGRDEEIAMLLRRWERARQGDRQLVMIVGEPGLGKSRLIEEFHARLREVPHTWVEWSCSQLLQNTPLHPIAEWGRQRFRGADVPAEQRLADLESSLAQVKLDPVENVVLLAPLLDIPLPTGRANTLLPEELRRRQLAALTAWVMAGARVQPVVLALEDLHWADPTTLDVLRGIAERGALAPLFVLMTARPEFRPPWGMRSHHGTISLAPLDREQVRHMVSELAARHALSGDVIESLTERTGGVPLFVEEVTRLLLERGEQAGIQAIPPTLQQSLTARLDRLGPAREAAQVGAVIGRGFSYGLLRAVAGMDDAPLQAALEKLADADIVLVQGLPPDSDYRFKHALIQDAAYENLLKSRRQVLHRRVAEILRDRFAETAGAEPEALAHHFTQAGMTDAAIEWWGKAGDQALRRSAFQEAIAHLGKAIEMADNSAGAAPRTATPAGARVKLQTNFGAALIAARGDASPETTAAFARARELAAAVADPMERLSANYGLWVGSLSRGEAGPLRTIAEAVLRDIQGKPASLEAAVAHRLAGTTEWYLGNFELARAHVGQALAMFDPMRDRDLTYRFGRDVGVSAMVFSALALWPLGETDEARRIGEEMLARTVASGHMLTMVYGHFQYALLHVARRDATATLPLAEAVVKLAREHDMPLYTAYGEFLHPWARWHLGEREGGLAAMRSGIAACQDMGNVLYTTLFETALAEAEAEAGEIEAALVSIDHAIALTERTGQRWNEADSHRARGEILLQCDPANTAPAEESFLTAIAVAQQQKAKTFELRAALALAKLYQSIGRAADAHAVLASALVGLARTSEFPEVGEAQMLLAALAEAEQVKSAAAARQQRLKLQTSYGQAMLWSRGFAAEETKAAFARARELTEGTENPAERFVTYFAQWVGSQVRGQCALARETAEVFQREAKNEGRATERVVALRVLGLTCIYQGEFIEAKAHLQEALKAYDPERDRDAKFRFGQDAIAGVFTYLAFTNWVLGHVSGVGARMEEGLRRAIESNHPSTRANINFLTATFQIIRGDVDAARRAAQAVVELSREHRLTQFAPWGAWSDGWVRARLGDRESGMADIRDAVATLIDQGNNLNVPLIWGLLAEFQAESDAEGALARIHEALALASETGEHWTDAFLHRIRGDIFLKRDPANNAPAEEAFLTAVAVAQHQKAKSLELRAAVSLTRLYQSTDRAADAHDVLAAALDGFSPTPEFPEVEEAHELLAAVAETDEVKNAAASRQRRLKLQTAYANALIHARGHGAPETSAAFAKAQTLAVGLSDAADRFSAYYGQWVGSLNRCEPAMMQEAAAAFLRATDLRPDSPEAGVACRISGLTRLYFGDYVDARASIEKALAILDSERDRDLAFRFGQDQVAAAMIYLALVVWPLGDVERARQLTDQAASQAAKSGNVQTLAYVNYHLCLFETLRGDRARAAPVAKAVLDLAGERAMPIWESAGRFFQGWANWLVGDQQVELAEMRRGIQRWRELGQAWHRPYLGALLAEAEASVGNSDLAIRELDRHLAEATSTNQRWSDAELHRIRGEILLKRDRGNAAPEEAFLTAIAIAQQQKARSFELRAAMSMARLWRDQGKRDQARELLAPVYNWFTEGFDTLDLKEAKVLLDELSS